MHIQPVKFGPMGQKSTGRRKQTVPLRGIICTNDTVAASVAFVLANESNTAGVTHRDASERADGFRILSKNEPEATGCK